MSAYSDAVLANNPLAYWRLDTTSGTETDLGSGGHTLTYTHTSGSPTLRGEPGLLYNDPDTCAKFLAFSNACTTPTTSDLTFTSAPFSVECWFNSTSFDFSGSNTLVAKGSFGNGGWKLCQRLGFLSLGFFGVVDINSTLSVAINATYHAVAVYRASGNTDLYLNNVKNNSGTGGTPTTNSQVTCISDESTNSGGSNFFGWIDEVAIYGSALSDADVATHYGIGYQAIASTFGARHSHFGPF